MVPHSQSRGPAAIAGCLAFFIAISPVLRAGHLDDMGYTKLVIKLGGATPTGAGVPVAQVEATAVMGMEVYLPQAGPGMGTFNFPGTGPYFSGKNFTDVSEGPGTKSSHADNVAVYYYGNITDPNMDANKRASMAPGVTTVSCLLADDYFFSDQFLLIQDRKVHSNAWVFTDSGGTLGTNTWLRRLDDDIDTHGYLPVGGVNNSGPVPEVLASGYNSLSVGLTNGNHSTGTTPGSVDGAGRVKPEIVAPGGIVSAGLDKTSYATGQVSSAATLLYEVATSVPAHSNACDENEVMKAILMAGATKEEFPMWSNSLAVPLDSTHGAGEVNVFESYEILDAGEQGAGGAVSRQGWDYGAVPSGSPAQEYTITVPNQFYADVSIVVTWNRFKDGGGPFAPYVVHDLNLRLENPGATIEWDRSDSAIDNVEHIYYRNLPPGQYVIELTRTGDPTKTTNYGLAWRMNLNKGPFMEAALSGSDVSLSFENLDPRVEYTIERSPGDLVMWAPIHTFTPTTPTNTDMPYLDTTASGDKVHYRLVWAFHTN